MKTRILHIVLSMETGGLENGIVNLVNHSNGDEFIVDILCLRERGELADRITNPTSQVFFDGNRSHSKLDAIKKVYALCRENKYDIIHNHGYATMLAGYVGGKLSSCKNIINGEHGTLYYSSKKDIFLQKFLFNRMQLNLSVSSELKNKICDIFSTSLSHFKTIINGVDTTKFYPHELSKQIKQQLQANDDDILIGSVGRLVAVKNYPSLIRAVKIVTNTLPNIKLILAGEGVERASIEELIQQLSLEKTVLLLGRRDDIPELMNLYDVFVLPSFSEGLSNTLLESMSCGTPVIASDVGGNSEIIVAGETGCLYESDNVEALAALLLKLINQEGKLAQMGKQARRHIEDNFSIASMVHNYEETYRQLMTAKVEI